MNIDICCIFSLKFVVTVSLKTNNYNYNYKNVGQVFIKIKFWIRMLMKESMYKWLIYEFYVAWWILKKSSDY